MCTSSELTKSLSGRLNHDRRRTQAPVREAERSIQAIWALRGPFQFYALLFGQFR